MYIGAKPQLHVTLYTLFQFYEISTFDLRVLNSVKCWSWRIYSLIIRIINSARGGGIKANYIFTCEPILYVHFPKRFIQKGYPMSCVHVYSIFFITCECISCASTWIESNSFQISTKSKCMDEQLYTCVCNEINRDQQFYALVDSWIHKPQNWMDMDPNLIFKYLLYFSYFTQHSIDQYVSFFIYSFIYLFIHLFLPPQLLF